MKDVKFKPLKAVSDELGFEDVSYPKVVSIKFDGVYGLNIGDQYFGRSLKPMKNKQLNSIMNNVAFAGWCGEVCIAHPEFHADGGDKSLNRQSLCRDTTSYTGSFDKVNDDILIVLFDYIGDASKAYCDKPFSERMVDLALDVGEKATFITKHNIAGIPYHEFMLNGISFFMPEAVVVNSAEEAEVFYEAATEAGYEGIILREPSGSYKFGRSTKKSQEKVRFKPSGDSEIIVTKLEEMMENQNEAKVNELGHTERSSHKENKVPLGMVGALIGIDINTGEEVKIGAGKLTHEERKALWEKGDRVLGCIAKYKFMATGQKDKPRHPRFISWRNVEDVEISEVALDNLKVLGISIK